MMNGKRVAVVMPAYNAEKTLKSTVLEIPDLVDIRILVDDNSSDDTVKLAESLGLQVYVHNRNYGYGRNQQTCYREALAAGAEVVIMVHPDYQYRSEYHTGYRAFSREVLTQLPLLENSDDFVFDNQVLAQCVHFGFRIGEVSCPTKYFEEASSINFRRSVKYGFGVLGTSVEFLFQKWGVLRLRRFSSNGKKLELTGYYAASAGRVQQ